MGTGAQRCQCAGPHSRLPPEEPECPSPPQCCYLWWSQLPASTFTANGSTLPLWVGDRPGGLA
ncbi:hypothetical protein IEO21_09663 [Rhodonia placenta]|uniref:Uncharacterized protein n=1 Tax=Rhodonia placenta TaxID=104341 RepID=A0A8H7NTZ3_9APHY|nr:hypothetical protein IEO21_09663 [Postia placenta]